MKRCNIFRVLIAVLMLSGVTFNTMAQSYNATYYVSASGNDATGTGTQSNPWASLAKTANVINGLGQGKNYLVYVMSDLTSEACARYYDNSVTITSLGTSIYTVTRASEFATQAETRRGWYNPAMLEIGSGDVVTGPIISLTLKNIIFDDAYLNPIPDKPVPNSFRFAPVAGTPSIDFVQDAIVACYSPRATVILGEGSKLHNFGGMTAARATDGATLILQTGSTIADIGSTTATRQVSTTTTDYRAKGEAAVSVVTGSHFYMYNGALITDIANAHSVKIAGVYKCFIDGEIRNMKGSKGMDATDGNQSPTHAGRSFKNAVMFNGGYTLDPTTGLAGSAIIGANANIHNNSVKCGAIAINRSTGVKVEIAGKVNNNNAMAGSTYVGSFALPAGTNGGGLYVVAGGTITLVEGSELCNNSVVSSAYGGAASIQQNNSKLIMNGGLVSGNTAPTGPGIAVNKGTASFEMNGGVVNNGVNGVLLFNNSTDTDCNGLLTMNTGQVSGVVVNSNVNFGNNTASSYRHLYLSDNMVIDNNFASVAGRQVYPVAANFHIGNPNTATYATISAAMPTGWHIPANATNVVAFWMKKNGTAEFSVPRPAMGTAATGYLSARSKFYVAVLETNAAGNANATTIKIYPTTIIGSGANTRVVVSVPLDTYSHGATVALVQPASNEELVIKGPKILKYSSTASGYTIPYKVIHDIATVRPQMIIDAHNVTNTNIQLVIYPDPVTIPILTSLNLSSEIFELAGTAWNAATGEFIINLTLKPNWNIATNTETIFMFDCEMDAADFHAGEFLYLTGNLSITGGAGGTPNYFLVFGNVVETEMTPTCPENAIDIEGNEYTITSLAGLCWTSNIKSTLYSNDGSAIPFAKAYYSTENSDTVANKSIFGLLYTWNSAMNVETLHATSLQGVCPNGWRLPTQTELNLLSAYPSEDLKSIDYWLVPGTNATGFDSRPAGRYSGASNKFVDLYGFTAYWSSDEGTSLTTHNLTFTYYCDIINEVITQKSDGLSVRCVEDL